MFDRTLAIFVSPDALTQVPIKFPLGDFIAVEFRSFGIKKRKFSSTFNFLQ